MSNEIGNVGAQVSAQSAQSANVQDNAQNVNLDGQQFSQVNNDPVSVQQRNDLQNSRTTITEKLQQAGADIKSFFSQASNAFGNIDNPFSGMGNKLSNLMHSISNLFKSGSNDNASQNISAPSIPLEAGPGADINHANNQQHAQMNEPGAAFDNIQITGDQYENMLSQAKLNQGDFDQDVDGIVIDSENSFEGSAEGVMDDLIDGDTAGILDDSLFEEDSDDIAIGQTNDAQVDGEDMDIDQIDLEGLDDGLDDDEDELGQAQQDSDKFKNDLKAAQVIEDLVMDDIVEDMESSINPQADTLGNEKVGE